MNNNIKIILTTLMTITFFLSFKSFAYADGIEVKLDGNKLEGRAIFDFDDVKPGDTIEKIVSVKNGYKFPQDLKVYCKKTLEEKDLSEILLFRIFVNGSSVFDGSLKLFCENPEGVSLGEFLKNQVKEVKFAVVFPKEAGNEYQEAKFAFNLIFGTVFEDGSHIVINEVYYDVDSEHGTDDSGGLGGNFNLDNYNIHEVFGRCFIFTHNVVPEGIGTTTNILGYKFINLDSCSRSTDEWIELYNPGDNDISLKDWYIDDNSGISNKISANKIIKAGGYALISKSASTWRFWDENPSAVKIELGRIIGDGLGNSGDHLILYDEYRNEVDAVGWENDNAVWNSNQPSASEGNSIERVADGVDDDLSSDWSEENPPSPGD